VSAELKHTRRDRAHTTNHESKCRCATGVLCSEKGRANDRREISLALLHIYGASLPAPIASSTQIWLRYSLRQHPQATFQNAQGERQTVYLRTITWSMPYPAFFQAWTHLHLVLPLHYCKAHQELHCSTARQPASSSARPRKTIALG
jgi:hypothetical protein